MAIDLIFLNKYGLVGLFIVTFISHTIIPFPSEAAIIASLIIFTPLEVFIVSLIGSTLGGLTNYYIGNKKIKGIFKRMPKTNKNAKKIFNKYGSLSILFFSSLPIIGDPLLILAGSLEMPFWKFSVFFFINRIFYLIIMVIFGMGINSLIGI